MCQQLSREIIASIESNHNSLSRDHVKSFNSQATPVGKSQQKEREITVIFFVNKNFVGKVQQ